MKYWYNVETGLVEEDEATSRKEHLMGPYDSREAAQGALATARERTEAWDEEERREREAEWKD